MATDKPNLNPKSIYEMATAVFDYCNSTMALPEMQRMMREEQFDLVITTGMGGRMLTGLATHFNCPLVYILQIRTPMLIASYLGNPAQLSSVNSLMSPVRDSVTFKSRLKNYLYSLAEYLIFGALDIVEGTYYKSNFNSPKYPAYNEARANASLILTATHFSQGVVATIPQIVEIGGIQMDVKLAPLSEKLQSYLDSAEEGVIFFSFGSNLKLKNLSQDKLWDILRALGKTNVKVLMKYDSDEEIPGLPANILTSAWLPQREILGE